MKKLIAWITILCLLSFAGCSAPGKNDPGDMVTDEQVISIAKSSTLSPRNQENKQKAETKPLDELLKSVQYDIETGELKFTIPEKMGTEKKLGLWISGRILADGTEMSWHAFEDESAHYSWIPEKTYTEKISADRLDFIIISASILDKDNSPSGDAWEIEIDNQGHIKRIDTCYPEKDLRSEPFTCAP